MHAIYSSVSNLRLKLLMHLAAVSMYRASREQEERKEGGTADSCVSLIKALEVH